MKTTDDKDLPESSASTDGATAGSLGGASMADLKRGYSNANSELDMAMDPLSDSFSHGFLDRPRGWAR